VTLCWTIFIVGIFMLYFGATWLVNGSSSLARSLGLKSLVIGLTVVAFGTSAPELVVSLVSSIQGKSMIAVGNVVGSNICNIALVLGLAAVMRPIWGHRMVFRRDIPIMLFVCFFLLLISLNSIIGRAEGAILFVGIILYTLLYYYLAIAESGKPSDTNCSDPGEAAREYEYTDSRFRQILLIAAGIAGVVAGAEMLIHSAVKIMNSLGVSEKFVGLTIVAFGTSLPELATSVVAAFRGEMDISIGNLVGSNVFNILSVIGVSALVRPIPIPGGFMQSGMLIDYLVMIFVGFLPWLMAGKTLVVSRKNGLVLLSCYAGYLAYLILKS